MKLFNCKVRIQGSVQDEVIKTGVTQAEIIVLRAIHGNDAVLDTVPEGLATVKVDPTDPESADRPRTEAEERDRLELLYGEAIVGKIFGAPIARIGDDAPAPVSPLARPASPARAKAAPIPELEDV